jgi:hypothetical protein
METLLLKGAFHFLVISSQSPPFFELFSYTGYKFVCLCLIVLAELAFGTLISYVTLFILGAFFALFFNKTIRAHCQSGNTLAEYQNDVSFNKKTLNLVCSLGQIFTIWVLSIN